MDSGEESIDDPALLRQLRRRALRINLESVLMGLILTLIALAL